MINNIKQNKRRAWLWVSVLFNIGLLGFKMAVNEGLTVFNLIEYLEQEEE